MNLNQEHYKQCEIFSQEKSFTSGQIFNKFHNVIAKSMTERENSNNLSKANITSTPKNRAFFVCGLHTPKERYNLACSSMVACSGQGIALGCFPLIAVFSPRYTLSPYTVRSVSDSPSKFIKGLLAMLFKFITLGEKRLKITVHARNEQEARNKLICSHAVLFARINTKGGIYA
ncbi:ash family protein [Actinobacillus equuli]|uniref:ash family protein n=1 Tax=Actinobacillus equuli TaxID=718 RepID=UPI0024424524|nr:ash family protein [Actinobacillus equuli]WGE43037.1 ash family protein [Actinobacillus equuli subsp. haemolyticus]